MMTIRLAIVRQKYRSDGGAECFIVQAMNALKSKEIEVNIITRQWLQNTQSKWHIHICNPSYIGRVARERSFAKAARQYWQNHDFDLVQSHERIVGCDIFRAGDGVHRAWLKHRARIVSTYYRLLTRTSLYHRYVLETERDMFQSPYLKKIICNSVMVKRDITQHYKVADNKCSIIYNAIASNKFIPANSSQRQAARKALLIPKHACVLVFVGSGFARKGLRQAIYAIADTDRYLVIVGKDKYQKRYFTLAQRLNCLSRLRFIGMQNNVLPYYHAADALILPTLYDPFPNVILEAMSCGLPIITSQSCGGAEFIRQGHEGFICDAMDIASIKEFINEIPLLEKDPTMGIAARQRVSNYTSENLAHQLISLYKQLTI